MTTFGDSMRQLKARFEDTSAQIGQGFLPIATNMVDLVAGPGLTALGAFGDTLGVVGKAVELTSSAFMGLPGPIQTALGAVAAMKLASMGLGTEMGTKLVAKMAAARTAMVTFSSGALSSTVTRFNTLRSATALAGGGVRGFGVVAGSVATQGLAKMRAGIGNVVNMLGGPWMLGLAAATAAIGAWVSGKNKAAEASRENTRVAQELGEQLGKTGGEYTKTGEAAARAALDSIELVSVSKTLAEVLDQAGVSADRAARGLAGMSVDASETLDELKRLAEEEERTNRERIGGGQSAASAVWNWLTTGDTGTTPVKNAAEEYEKALAEVREEQRRVQTETYRTQTALESTFGSDISTAGIKQLEEAMETLGDEFASTTDKVDALEKALNSLMHDELTLDEAQKEWGAFARGLGEDFGALAEDALNADGSINLFSESGAKLHDVLIDGGEAINKWIAAMKADGATVEEQATAINHLRGELVDLITPLVGSKEAAQDLVNSVLTMPEDIIGAANIDLVNELTASLGDLEVGIKRIDDGAVITVDVLDREMIEKLEDAGYRVQSLPDGEVKIIPVTEDAKAEIADVAEAADGIGDKTVTVNIDGDVYTIGQLNELADLVNADNDKDIVIDSNATDVIELVEALGGTVERLPNGDFVITDNVPEVQRRVNELNGKQTTGTHTVTIRQVAEATTPHSLIFSNADGSIRTRAQGALDTAQIKAGSGDGIVQHTGFGPVQWAEGETGWEAFIPGAASKRRRSTQILVETAKRMGYGVIPLDAIRMADGGVRTTSIDEFAQGVEGQQYTWGGSGSWATDCSGAVSRVANYATGRDPDEARTSTATMGSFLAERGFVPGPGGSGDLTVGWYNGGPYGGHTSLTLPSGTNVEMGGARGDGQYGGTAASAFDPMYTDHMHLPGDQVMGAYGDDDNGIEGGGTYGAGAGGGLGGSGGSGGSGSGGHGTPVQVTNWPSGVARGGGDMTVNTSHVLADMPPITDVIEEAEENDQYRPEIDLSRVPAAGRDSILGDLGLSGDGFLSQLVKQAPEIDRLLREQAEKDAENGITINNTYQVTVADQESFHRRAEDDLRRNIAQFGGNS